MFVFRKLGVLCILVAPVLRFALLSYYRRFTEKISVFSLDAAINFSHKSKKLSFGTKEIFELRTTISCAIGFKYYTVRVELPIAIS